MNLRTLASLSALLVLVGCENAVEEPHPQPEPSAEEWSHTVRAGTLYYIGGPQQSRPADGSFLEDTVVTLLESAGSYVLVETKNHLRAWVSSDAVQ